MIDNPSLRAVARQPRIGLCGGMANNTYIMAKAFAQTGSDVCFFRDRWDAYAMSQPVWEDGSFMLSHEQTVASSTWSADDWKAIERAQGWCDPKWMLDPPVHRRRVLPRTPKLPGVGVRVTSETHPGLSADVRVRVQAYLSKPQGVLPRNWRRYVAQFQRCDLLFVCQTNAIMLALLSGTPFFICPAGGEWMIAAGLIKGEGAAVPIIAKYRELLKLAFDSSIATVSSTPKPANAAMVGGDAVWQRDFAHIPYAQIGLPFTPEHLRSRSEKQAILAEAARCSNLGLQLEPDDQVIFVPSRISYADKGQDRLLEGWRAAGCPQNLKFIFTAWGADFLDFKQKTNDYTHCFHFLDGALSKALLRNFYRGADLVVDQFTLGHYGTSSREALATGTPAVCWVNPDWAKNEPGHELAPVISLNTVDTIAPFLTQIAAGAVDLQAVGQAGLDWTQRYSSPEVICRQLLEVYEAYPHKVERQQVSRWQTVLANLLGS